MRTEKGSQKKICGKKKEVSNTPKRKMEKTAYAIC